MKRGFFVLCLMTFGMAGFAIAKVQKGLKVDTQFSYSENGKKQSTKSTMIIAADNKTWNTLTEPKEGVALLGRVTQVDQNSIQMEYIVVDTKKNNAVISTPMMIAKPGQTSEITIGESTDQIAITFLGTPTEYKVK